MSLGQQNDCPIPQQERNPGEWMILCPKCKDDNVHLMYVQVLQNGQSIKVTRVNTNVCEAGQTSYRGTTIEIGLWCECGHNTSLRFQFHKGNTFVDSCLRTGVKKETELWRD